MLKSGIYQKKRNAYTLDTFGVPISIGFEVKGISTFANLQVLQVCVLNECRHAKNAGCCRGHVYLELTCFENVWAGECVAGWLAGWLGA